MRRLGRTAVDDAGLVEMDVGLDQLLSTGTRWRQRTARSNVKIGSSAAMRST